MFSDDQGRYVAVECIYKNWKILVVNIYAPNGSKTSFFRDLQNKLNNVVYEHIILAGDFNGTVNNELDRSNKMKKNKKNNKTGKLPKTFFNLIEQVNLTDIWRKRNKKQRDYTFYSDRHKSWLRLDMVWVTKELELITKKIEIMTSSISDHNPILWQSLDNNDQRKRWIINEDLLDKQEIIENIKKDIQEYFTINLTPDMNASVI